MWSEIPNSFEPDDYLAWAANTRSDALNELGDWSDYSIWMCMKIDSSENAACLGHLLISQWWLEPVSKRKIVTEVGSEPRVANGLKRLKNDFVNIINCYWYLQDSQPMYVVTPPINEKSVLLIPGTFNHFDHPELSYLWTQANALIVEPNTEKARPMLPFPITSFLEEVLTQIKHDKDSNTFFIDLTYTQLVKMGYYRGNLSTHFNSLSHFLASNGFYFSHQLRGKGKNRNGMSIEIISTNN